MSVFTKIAIGSQRTAQNWVFICGV